MSLSLNIKTIPDPDGHNPTLLLKGDWIIIEISDGHHTGRGEASHSRDDKGCIRTVARLFDQYVRDSRLSIEAILGLERNPFSKPKDFIEATVISGINQALYELLALNEGIPVWRLFSVEPKKTAIPVYATINRALTDRSPENYCSVISSALDQGFNQIKCAPFEKVTKHGNQLEQCKAGLNILGKIQDAFNELSIRIDFHQRFTYESFLRILPEIESFNPTWIEEPIPIGSQYAELVKSSKSDIALGELYFGLRGFQKIMDNAWAKIIMPDVKHVGGFGPLNRVIGYADGRVEVSPHNPSGPIATAASIHAAMLSSCVTSLELPLIVDSDRAYYKNWLKNGTLSVPSGNGWGIDYFSS